MTALQRRTLLTTLSAVSVSAIAGCNGSDDGDSETDDGNETTPDDGSEGDTDGEEPASPETITEAATLLVEDFANGRFDDASGRFVSSPRGGTSPGQLEQIWMALTAVGGEYDGIADTTETIDSGNDAVDVTVGFDRSDHHLRVVVNDELAVRSLTFRDEYERPAYVATDAFDETDVTLETESCSLGGTVTTPADESGGVPGVVLVHGSGPVDRNADGGGTRLFQDLAEGLATRGIATLRYDKRTYACPNQMDEHTLETGTVADALTAIERLRGVDGVDPDRIVLVGHSLGGLAAPRIAARDGGLAGAVGLAAPARSFAELTVDQVAYQAELGDYEWEQMTRLHEDWSDRVERVRAGDYNRTDAILGYSGAFWDSLADYDQVATAREIDAPLLFCQGERDFRVTVEDDFRLWRDELEGRPETDFERYDRLNHAFMPGEGPSTQFEYAVRNNLDERVLDDLVDWIGAR